MEDGMWVKVRQVGRGLHPSETVVEIQTVGGPERLVVDKKSIQKEPSLLVGEF